MAKPESLPPFPPTLEDGDIKVPTFPCFKKRYPTSPNLPKDPSVEDTLMETYNGRKRL